MEKIWSNEAWNDYISWQQQDKKTIKKINPKSRPRYL